MNEKQLRKLLENPEIVKEKIRKYLEEKTLVKQGTSKDEIKGHLAKADHNLRFVHDNLQLGYNDWCIAGCYYAVYQAASALILAKGNSSKSHDATLCILILEYYKKGIEDSEIEMINKSFLDYQEVSFYVESKQKREDATYSTRIKYDKQAVTQLRIKAALFVDKAKQILNKI